MPVTSAPTLAGAPLASALLWLSAVLYGLGLAALGIRRLRGVPRPLGLIDHLPVALGFGSQLGALVMEARLVGRFPLGNLPEFAAFLAFLLAGSYLFAAARFRYPAFEALLLVLALGFLGLSFALPSAPDAVPPSLHSRWFVFHTLLSLLGVTALFAACIVSILYLLAEERLKRKKPSFRLPSLVTADRTALRLLVLGFPLLTLGIAAGWFWSREAGRYAFGPKELWAMTAWGIYAVLVFVRVARGWRGRRVALLSVSGALAALGAIFGIRL